jgi:hypothetical protein
MNLKNMNYNDKEVLLTTGSFSYTGICKILLIHYTSVLF